MGIGAHAAGALREVLHVAGRARPKSFPRRGTGAAIARASLTPVLHFHFVLAGLRYGSGSMTTGPAWLWGVFSFAHGCSLLVFMNGDSLSQKPGSLQPMHDVRAHGQLSVEFDLRAVVHSVRPLQPSSYKHQPLRASESKEERIRRCRRSRRSHWSCTLP